MVTGSKKPQTSATKTKAAAAKSTTSTPKATAKAKTAASSAAKPGTTKKAKAPASKAAAKPRTTTRTKTTSRKTGVVKAVEARKVGEMVYNDELLESLAEMVLRGGEADLADVLPEIKKQMYGYDIYLVSFLNDGEIGEIAGNLAKLCKADAKDLTDRLITVRESARTFVTIAGTHNSVRAYIDRAIEADGREAGIGRIKEAFLAGEYCIADIDSATYGSFLTLF